MKSKTAMVLVVILVCLTFAGCSGINGSQTSSPSSQSTVSLIGSKEIVVEAGDVFFDPGAVDSDGSEISADSEADTGTAGEYRLTYSSESGSQSRTVKVVDTKAPTITLKGGKEMTVSAELLFSDPGVIVDDNASAAPELKIERSPTVDGKFTVTYTATDLSGNSASASRTVIIKDIVSPTVRLSGDSEMYVEVDGEYAEPGYSAVDDLDGDLTESVKVSGKVDTSAVGVYTVTYTVADIAGNTASVKRTVRVYDQQPDNPDRVYLTFDDGPSTKITPRVLDILKRNDVKATFFIINYSDSNKAIVQRIVDEGHTLAIHAYNHDYRACYSSVDAYMSGLEKMRSKIVEDTGYEPKVIRFPGGTSNTVSRNYCTGVMSALAKKVVEAGYTYFDWNVSSGDAAAKTASSSQIYKNVTSGLRRGKNNVVLMHDTNAKATTADALEDIIKYCKSNGYTVLPITPETEPVRHKANN